MMVKAKAMEVSANLLNGGEPVAVPVNAHSSNESLSKRVSKLEHQLKNCLMELRKMDAVLKQNKALEERVKTLELELKEKHGLPGANIKVKLVARGPGGLFHCKLCGAGSRDSSHPFVRETELARHYTFAHQIPLILNVPLQDKPNLPNSSKRVATSTARADAPNHPTPRFRVAGPAIKAQLKKAKAKKTTGGSGSGSGSEIGFGIKRKPGRPKKRKLDEDGLVTPKRNGDVAVPVPVQIQGPKLKRGPGRLRKVNVTLPASSKLTKTNPKSEDEQPESGSAENKHESFVVAGQEVKVKVKPVRGRPKKGNGSGPSRPKAPKLDEGDEEIDEEELLEV